MVKELLAQRTYGGRVKALERYFDSINWHSNYRPLTIGPIAAVAGNEGELLKYCKMDDEELEEENVKLQKSSVSALGQLFKEKNELAGKRLIKKLFDIYLERVRVLLVLLGYEIKYEEKEELYFEELRGTVEDCIGYGHRLRKMGMRDMGKRLEKSLIRIGALPGIKYTMVKILEKVNS